MVAITTTTDWTGPGVGEEFKSSFFFIPLSGKLRVLTFGHLYHLNGENYW